jgi:hypothetical protein
MELFLFALALMAAALSIGRAVAAFHDWKSK